MFVLPTAYFGSISWYRELAANRQVYINGAEIFSRQTFRNRCCIATPQGISKLSVPVEKVNGPATLTADVRISTQKDWRKDHWRSLQSNYAFSPYFEHYEQEIHALIYNEEKSLLRFNQAITEFMLKQFGLSVNFLEEKPEGAIEPVRTNFETAGPKDVFEAYEQVYFGENVFYGNLSILDLLFCIGPAARNYLTIK